MKKTQLLLLLPAFLAVTAISACCCPHYRPPMNAGCRSGDRSINGACPDQQSAHPPAGK